MDSQTALNIINSELAKKDLSWKDRMYLMQIKTAYINSQANSLSANSSVTNAQASMMNAKTNAINSRNDMAKFIGGAFLVLVR